MNTLIAIQDGLSMAVINGGEYPIVAVSIEHATIAVSDAQSAEGIAKRVDGTKAATPNGEFPFEVKVGLEKFDQVFDAKNWEELITRYFVK